MRHVDRFVRCRPSAPRPTVPHSLSVIFSTFHGEQEGSFSFRHRHLLYGLFLLVICQFPPNMEVE
jgi:hypothetical protein